MGMRSIGLLLTGGLALMLVVFITSAAFLLSTESMPFHLEIKEPVTNIQKTDQPQNVALPQQVRQLDPEYVLTDLYGAKDAPPPEFHYVDTGTDGNSITESGVDGGVVSFAGGEVFVGGKQVGTIPVPARGEARVVGSVVTITNVGVASGYADAGPSLGDGDNTASITTTDGITVFANGWENYSDDTFNDTNPLSTGRQNVDVSQTDTVDVVLTGGVILITGLADGADTCQATVVVGRTLDESTSPDPMWGEFSGRAAEIRLSGLLSFTVPVEDETVEVDGTLYVDTGANGDWDDDNNDGNPAIGTYDGVIIRNTDGSPDATRDLTAVRLATLPLPTVRSDIDDGAVTLPLEVGTRVALADYGDATNDATPELREVQLVVTIRELNAIQCGAIDNIRWERPSLGTITTRNSFCGGVPLGGAVGQALTKLSDDDCDVGWVTVRDVPDGGADDEVLTWDGAFSTYAWEPVPDQSGGG